MGLDPVDFAEPPRDARIGLPPGQGCPSIALDIDIDPRLPHAQRARIPVAFERAAAKAAGASENPAAESLLEAARHARTARQRVVWLLRWGSAWIAPLATTAPCRRGCAHCCHIPVLITSAEARLLSQATGRRAAAPESALPLAELVSANDAQAFDDALRRAHELVNHWAATSAREPLRQTARETSRESVGELLREPPTDGGADPALEGAAGTAGEGPCPFLQASECSAYEHRPFACRTHITLDDDDLLCQLLPGIDVPMPYADTSAVRALFLAAQPAEVVADIRAFFPAAACAQGPAGAANSGAREA